MGHVATTVVLALAASILLGATVLIDLDSKPMEMLVTFAGILLGGLVIAYWYRRDTESLGTAWSRWWLLAMVVPLTSFFAISAYLFVSRPIPRSFLAFGAFIAICVLCTATLFGTAFLALGFVA